MRFRLGINYWPARKAMYWWRRFDVAEVEGDYRQIRGAGFDSVRIFLLWEDFQPRPDKVADEALRNLLDVADIASATGLSLIVTLFTGHMSGVNWFPEWAIAPDGPQRFRVFSGGRTVPAAPKNWYADDGIRSAQVSLAREVASALRRHPALWAYDLGNENSNCAVPPSREAALGWLHEMATAIRSADGAHPITIGLHAEDLEENRNLGPAEASTVCDFVSMHGYPKYLSWARNTTDWAVLPFLGLITRWLCAKDVLFQEFGTPTELSSESEHEAAVFTRQALAGLRDFGFCGAMLWCFSDYSEDLWRLPPLDEAPHERCFGLWRSDGSEKPALNEIRRFAGVERGDREIDLKWIDIRPDEFWRDCAFHLRRLYHLFAEHQSHDLCPSN